MDSYFDPFKKEVRFLYNNESKEKKINPACLVTGKEKLNIPFHYLNLFIFLDDPLFFSDLKKIFHSLNVSGPRLGEGEAAELETKQLLMLFDIIRTNNVDILHTDKSWKKRIEVPHTKRAELSCRGTDACHI